ncbi:MAG: FmdB family zinc ribbon protein [Sphaerochaetaceae bacterium]|jgi:putative FmdB family regulatory protein|nr:zinc ribbon domain-containing protein [Sphaerochaetaceae bacterium]MDX9809185.1 zinc ribbon domain-containing protein [Sphaerochaetaceae bacterium]NLV83480.1 FmdB family transcriptional regulator [Spirochaetales bacterium]
MPTYEYECDACHVHFEMEQSMREAPITVCPTCSGRVRRVFGLNSVIFKGSGFYCTDHKKGESVDSCPKDNGNNCASCPAV